YPFLLEDGGITRHRSEPAIHMLLFMAVYEPGSGGKGDEVSKIILPVNDGFIFARDFIRLLCRPSDQLLLSDSNGSAELRCTCYRRVVDVIFAHHYVAIRSDIPAADHRIIHASY